MQTFCHTEDLTLYVKEMQSAQKVKTRRTNKSYCTLERIWQIVAKFNLVMFLWVNLFYVYQTRPPKKIKFCEYVT